MAQSCIQSQSGLARSSGSVLSETRCERRGLRAQTRRVHQVSTPDNCLQPGPRQRMWLVVIVKHLCWLLLAGYLLFAHGCHADEDTELLVRCAHDDIVNT